ncbi:hypothetical protein MATL_G00048980 [Megalops atlanticus]|uniref:Mitochondrial import inner membrane translocase subunit Tim10 B n=1 Tax=Megalops atlanticus TaxID=7932 RepID=A0A9D3QBA9_MEGAT|nr:hypothetical protein MATL_G00048980 [Megalops atlanticus]
MEQDQQQLRNERCVDNCAGKLIRSNHRLMGTYVQLMPGIVQRKLEELETKAAEAGAAAETALPTPVTTPIVEKPIQQQQVSLTNLPSSSESSPPLSAAPLVQPGQDSQPPS